MEKVKIMRVIVKDAEPYIGILYDNNLYLLDGGSFTNVLFRRKLYWGWVGYCPPDYELEIEPAIERRYIVQRVRSNLYILSREDVEDDIVICGVDRWWK